MSMKLVPPSLPRFQPLVPSTLYPQLSLALITFGLLLMGWFFTMSVSSTSNEESSSEEKKSKKRQQEEDSSLSSSLSRVAKELAVALTASFFLGFGLLFLALNVGLYV